MSFPILSAILAIPTAALGAILLWPAAGVRAIRGIAAASGAATLVLSLWLACAYDSSRAGFQFSERIAWLPSFGIDYALGVDGISIAMILLTSIILLCGAVVSWTVEKRPKEFYANLLFLTIGVFGVFMSTNLFFFFLFYEIAVLPMYLLIVVWGSTNKEYAAMKLTLYLLFGSALIIAGFLAIYALPTAGTFDLIALKEHVVFSRGFQLVLFPTLFFGFGVLAGCFPFHVWSPDGHVAAPTAASMMHAGVLMKLGVYGILRIAVWLFPEGAAAWAWPCAILALCNIIYGALVATQQRDLKYMIGYSSVSHMGIALLGIMTLTQTGVNGAVYQMFSHGLMTALFFACVGHIYDISHTRNLDELGGLSRTAPKISAIFILAGLAGLGLPGLSGFIAEFLVTIAAIKVFPWIGLTSIIGLLITAYYVLTAMQRAFYGRPGAVALKMTDVAGAQLAARGLLAGLLVLFGVYPELLLGWVRVSTQVILGVAS